MDLETTARLPARKQRTIGQKPGGGHLSLIPVSIPLGILAQYISNKVGRVNGEHYFSPGPGHRGKTMMSNGLI